MTMGNDINTLTLTLTDWFHYAWADERWGTAARASANNTEVEVSVEFRGPIVEHFQTLVERDWIVQWADTAVELEITGESYYTTNSGELHRAVEVEFTLVTERYFKRPVYAKAEV